MRIDIAVDVRLPQPALQFPFLKKKYVSDHSVTIMHIKTTFAMHYDIIITQLQEEKSRPFWGRCLHLQICVWQSWMQFTSISSIIGGDGFAQNRHADRKSASVSAPSGAGRTVHVRLKPHLPRIFELIRSRDTECATSRSVAVRCQGSG